MSHWLIARSDALNEAVLAKLESVNADAKKQKLPKKSVAKLIREVVASYLGNPKLAELDTKLGRPRREDSE